MNVDPKPIAAAKYYLRYLIQIPSIYRPADLPHIFLFSNRRGGSTLLLNLLHSQPGFNFINQPLDFKQFNPYLKLLPNVPESQFISLDAAGKAQLERFIDLSLGRKYITRSQWQFWKKNYHWQWERYVVKLINAKAMIDWFTGTWRGRAQIVFAIRHPIPTALSIIKNKWTTIARPYLQDEWFAENYLSPQLVEFSQGILSTGSALEIHALEWCLENLVPLKHWRERDWVTISYERILSEPERVAQRLCKQLHLPDWQAIVATLEQPSRTTVLQSRQAIMSQGPQARISSWESRVNAEQRRQVAAILDAFEIDLYNVDSPYPKADFDT